MKTEASYTAKLDVRKPDDIAHFWVRGDYGSTVSITCISNVSSEHAEEAIREFARKLMEEVAE